MKIKQIIETLFPLRANLVGVLQAPLSLPRRGAGVRLKRSEKDSFWYIFRYFQPHSLTLSPYEGEREQNPYKISLRGVGGLALVLLLTSCEKEITLDLNSVNSKFVIEGEIAQNAKAKVRITKTVDFTQSNNFPAVRGASVSLSDGSGNTESLVETSAGVYESQKMVGTEGKTYQLTVVADGSTFTAQTTMPTNVKLTGVKVQKSSFSPPGSTSDNYIIYPQFIDPATFGNSYRFIQIRNGEIDKSIIVANDNIGNGLPNSRPLLSRDFEILLGDKVTLEMRCIDKPIYDYFYSLNAVEGNGPGGGTIPANPVTNIKGGALGYFSAHTVQKISMEVK